MAEEFTPLASMVYGASPLRGSLIQADRHIQMLNSAGKKQEAAQYYQTAIEQISAIGGSQSQAEVQSLMGGLNSTLTGLNAYTEGISQSMQAQQTVQEKRSQEANEIAQSVQALTEMSASRGVPVDGNLVTMIVSLLDQGNIAGARVGMAKLSRDFESNEIKQEKLREELKGQTSAMEASGDLASKINRFVTPSGGVTPALDDATGFGEEAGTWFGKVTGGLLGNKPKTISDQQVLNRVIEKDLLEASKYLKPVSNDEMKMLRKNRPQITDPPEVWADYLNDVRDVLNRDMELWQESIQSLAPNIVQQAGPPRPTPAQATQSPYPRANEFFRRYPQGQ